MRVAIPVGPDAGHIFPCLALAVRLRNAGHEPLLLSGGPWYGQAERAGIDAVELPGLHPEPGDDEDDQGYKLHGRAARMAPALAGVLRDSRIDLVVADVMVAAGQMAAEIVGIPCVELCPHPLYHPSRALPPIGSGLAPAVNLREKARDILLRSMTARSLRQGRRQREEARASIGLHPEDPGPTLRLLATLPGMEPARPDWPERTHVVGPLVWEPTERELPIPTGEGPLVMVAPSTVTDAGIGLLDTVLAARGLLGGAGAGIRIVSTAGEHRSGPGLSVGPGRQDLLLDRADVLVCGSGHGILMKAFLAGTPMVLAPGGGDQWELANRVGRLGAGEVVRPVTPESVAAALTRVLADDSHVRACRAVARTGERVEDPVALCEGAVV